MGRGASFRGLAKGHDMMRTTALPATLASALLVAAPLAMAAGVPVRSILLPAKSPKIPHPARARRPNEPTPPEGRFQSAIHTAAECPGCLPALCGSTRMQAMMNAAITAEAIGRLNASPP